MRSDEVTQGFIELDLEDLHVWRLHSLSGQPASLLDCPHHEVSAIPLSKHHNVAKKL